MTTSIEYYMDFLLLRARSFARYYGRRAYCLVPLLAAQTFLAGNEGCQQDDQDGDGWTQDAGDCNDQNPKVNPGMSEICNDGIDNNCDLEPCLLTGEHSLANADARLEGENVNDHTGITVSSGGDINADGYDDLLIGAYGDIGGSGDFEGAAYVVYGPVQGRIDLGDADAILLGENPHDYVGVSVSSSGDVNGDGYDDVLLGAFREDSGGTDAGAAYLFYGPVLGAYDLSEADAKLIGEYPGDDAGRSVSLDGDVNGDGFNDILVGAYYEDSGGTTAGMTYLFYGPISSTLDCGEADARFVGENGDDYSGIMVTSAGDVNGDGFDDIAIGAYRENSGGTDAGAAYLFYGPVLGSHDLSEADVKLVGENSSDVAGLAISTSGDVNGDGFDDVMVGARWNDGAATNTGAAYLFYGPLSGTIDLSTAPVKLEGESASDEAGWWVSTEGDLNGDGVIDLAIGAEGYSGGTMTGATYVIYGPIEGSMNLSESDAVFIGEAPSDYSGHVLSTGGDINGDGIDDLVVGAHGNDSAGSAAGVVYVVMGKGF